MICCSSTSKRISRPPLRWYDVLLELDRAGPDGLRQFEICDSVLLSKYNVSRLLDRLESEGLLTRYACEDDARGTRVLISGKGRELRKRMWKTYGPALHTYFAEHFSQSELEQLSDLLGRLPGVQRPTR